MVVTRREHASYAERSLSDKSGDSGVDRIAEFGEPTYICELIENYDSRCSAQPCEVTNAEIKGCNVAVGRCFLFLRNF